MLLERCPMALAGELAWHPLRLLLRITMQDDPPLFHSSCL